MPTYDYLRKQALKDVWRVPTLDRQFIIEPRRITKAYGRVKHVTVMWETLALPDTSSKWHVYDAGPVSPIALNLFKKCSGWTPLSEATNQRGVYTNVYVNSGIELPRFDSFYRYTKTGSLVFAFKINKKLKMNLDLDKVYIRVYSGAAINIHQLPPATTKIKTNGVYVTSPTDIDDLQDEIDLLPAPGHTNIYHNGIWYDDLSKISIVVGDYIEYIYDSSVYKTFEFAVADLFHYNSLVDGDQKYILHYPGVSTTVDFYDDIDIYVFQKDGGEPLRGIYYHKNDESSVRQLTHRDYAIRTRSFASISNIIKDLIEPIKDAPIDSLFIRLDVRQSALTNVNLVFENTRLFELYKLQDSDIMRALQGIDANVPFWSAVELEKSKYSYAMRCDYNQLTREVAEQMYGYNASAKIVGDTPIKLAVPGIQEIPLPIRMQHGCTAYEYDSEGLLINWYQHMAGLKYTTKNATCVYVEAIVGLGSDRLDQIHNVKNLQLNEVFTYRFYNGSAVGNYVQNTFEDVTGSDKYTIVDGLFTWTSPRAADYPIVMSDSKFYAKDYKVKPQAGTISVKLTTQQNRPQGDGLYAMPIPMGQMDVFLNKHSLIKGLDYYIDFPEVVIVNKEFLIDALVTDQDVHVRFCGFPTKDLEIMGEGDIGFIEHGFLSNNNKYDIRDDKVQRVIIGGKLYTKSELEFSEDHQGVAITDAANGLPYMVKDILVPIKPYTVEDMYALKAKSVAIDKTVSDYLTMKLPQPDRGTLMAIPNKYHVFSPFMNKLITDIRSGVISLPLRIDGFSTQEVIDICKPYEYLLKNDPIKSPYLQDQRFVAVDPHGYAQVLPVTANAYRFLNSAVNIYCDGLIALSPFLKTI